MRTQWRLILLRCLDRSQPRISGHLSDSRSLVRNRLFSSLIHSRASQVLQPHSLVFLSQNASLRCFSSSELAVDDKDSDQVAVLIDVFSKSDRIKEEIKLELESNNICISHEMILKVLQNLEHAPKVARRFFDWVLELERKNLSSKSYNLMLRLLGMNGFVDEFWDLVGDMKKKGYGVSKGTFVRVLEKFEKDELASNVAKLKEFYASGASDGSAENACSRVCKVIRANVWGDDVEKQLQELNVEFSSDLIAEVTKHLGTEPNKALIFFRWVEESGLVKHDERTYNAITTVLGRKDSVEKFWRVVYEMREAGYEMEKETYVQVLGQFIKNKMIKDAVELYELAMNGINKPSVQDSTFLLKKIVVSPELDMDLFSRVVRTCKDRGNGLPKTTFDAVFKSLTSVGRFAEYNKILSVMEESGLLPNGTLQSNMAFQLSTHGEKEEVRKLINNLESSGFKPNHKMWVSLVEGYCVADDLDKASDYFQEMVDKDGVSCAGYALELLVKKYCLKKRAVDVSKLLSEMITGKELKPWHTTYKLLISKLLAQRAFREALNLLGLMKSQGYPPFLDPFVDYTSKRGTADDAITFLKAVTVNQFPSTSVVLRVFESFLKTGRHNEAQELLSKCPGYVRSHADVLNLFCSLKSGDIAVTTSVAS